jgi:hypothetical protein
MAQSEPRDIWSKITAISALIASVLIPVVVVVVSNLFTSAMKDSENRVRYIELAIGILKSPPSADTDNLRTWAVDVINKHSDVPMDSKTKDELRKNKIISTVPWEELAGIEYKTLRDELARQERLKQEQLREQLKKYAK